MITFINILDSNTFSLKVSFCKLRDVCRQSRFFDSSLYLVVSSEHFFSGYMQIKSEEPFAKLTHQNSTRNSKFLTQIIAKSRNVELQNFCSSFWWVLAQKKSCPNQNASVYVPYFKDLIPSRLSFPALLEFQAARKTWMGFTTHCTGKLELTKLFPNDIFHRFLKAISNAVSVWEDRKWLLRVFFHEFDLESVGFKK